MIHIYLDDYRACPKGFVHARNAEECVMLLKAFEVDVLSLDYDLGWGQPNGMSVANYIVSSGNYPKRIYFHTSSSGGRQTMYQALYPGKPDHTALFNGPMPAEILMEVAESDQE
ncbi:cyclic-phosphate processing receiver domain-containing protein [Paenibacillus allorhizosphaerae]|uniref:Cyclic-phosphate processing Receiver domain-containing protein n=1 Tax=Paenibacillus allorhizosphaerae TaxID=2849866 RepID=A0ABN7TRJ3_9BACL|nr:cyclic-phosphate processing receiver domain-containing protein [Paenibacillus allorhizosphaerae]CAG7648210.1 hypothetical protein PAECIP111802_04152 [Paenibacillus allorhizosphaerae]